jgi:hypothetical protein
MSLVTDGEAYVKESVDAERDPDHTPARASMPIVDK